MAPKSECALPLSSMLVRPTAAAASKTLGACMGPRANSTISPEVLRGLGNLQGDYRECRTFIARKPLRGVAQDVVKVR